MTPSAASAKRGFRSRIQPHCRLWLQTSPLPTVAFKPTQLCNSVICRRCPRRSSAPRTARKRRRHQAYSGQTELPPALPPPERVRGPAGWECDAVCWERLLGEAMGHHPFPIPPHPPFPRRNRLWQHPVSPLLPRSSPFQTESKAKGNTRLLRGASSRLPALQSCSAPAAASRDSGVRSDGCKQLCASPCPENASGTGRRGLRREPGGGTAVAGQWGQGGTRLPGKV